MCRPQINRRATRCVACPSSQMEGGSMPEPGMQSGYGNISIEQEGGNYFASEVTEGDMVSGIEVSPVPIDSKLIKEPYLSMATMSTAGTSSCESCSSGSWSESPSSSRESSKSSSFEGEIGIIMEVDQSDSDETDDQNSHGHCWPYLPTIKEESSIGPLTPPHHRVSGWDMNKTDLRLLNNLEEYLSMASSVNRPAIELAMANQATVRVREVINLKEPLPLLHEVLSRFPSHLLCQLNVRFGDILHIPRNNGIARDISQGQLNPLPRKASVSVSPSGGLNKMSVFIGGGLTPDVVLSKMFRKAGNNIHSQLQTFCYDHEPDSAQQNSSSFPTDVSSMRIQLTKWRKKSSKSKRPRKRRLEFTETRESLEEQGKKTVCTPRMLPIVANVFGKEDKEEFCDVVQDEELRAILDITDNGNDVSALFPSFSTDSLHMAESMDGLEEEMGTLESTEDALRRELDAANFGFPTTMRRKDESPLPNDESLLRDEDESVLSLHSDINSFEEIKLIDSDSTEKQAPRGDGVLEDDGLIEDSNLNSSANEESSSILDHNSGRSRTDMIISSISSEDELENWPTMDLSTTSSGFSTRSLNRVVRMPGTKGRKVRFSEAENQEFLYISDYDDSLPPLDDNDHDDDDDGGSCDCDCDDDEEGGNNGESSAGILGAVEDAFYALEDMMDTLSFSCTGAAPAADSMQPNQSVTRQRKRS